GRLGVKFFQDVEPAFIGHRDIEQDDIAWLRLEDLEGFIAVAGFGGDGHSGILGNNALQTFADNCMVIDYTYFDHCSTGIVMSSVVPFPCSEEIVMAPPIREIRSFIPTIPSDC